MEYASLTQKLVAGFQFCEQPGVARHTAQVPAGSSCLQVSHGLHRIHSIARILPLGRSGHQHPRSRVENAAALFLYGW
jgi:hypothetical protein